MNLQFLWSPSLSIVTYRDFSNHLCNYSLLSLYVVPGIPGLIIPPYCPSHCKYYSFFRSCSLPPEAYGANPGGADRRLRAVGFPKDLLRSDAFCPRERQLHPKKRASPLTQPFSSVQMVEVACSPLSLDHEMETLSFVSSCTVTRRSVSACSSPDSFWQACLGEAQRTIPASSSEGLFFFFGQRAGGGVETPIGESMAAFSGVSVTAAQRSLTRIPTGSLGWGAPPGPQAPTRGVASPC